MKNIDIKQLRVTWLQFHVFLLFTLVSHLSAFEYRDTGFVTLTLIPVAVKQDSNSNPEKLEVSANVQGAPNHTVLMKFNFNTLLYQAKIRTVCLILTAQTMSPKASQTLTVSIVNQDGRVLDSLFGKSTMDFGEPKENMHAIWQASPKILERLGKTRDSIWLKITTNSTGEARIWYSNKTVESRYRPRLTIEYSSGEATEHQSSGFQAVYSPRAFLPKNSIHRFSIAPYAFPTTWSYVPAFYINRSYVITDSIGQKTLLELDELGTPLRSLILSSSGNKKNLGQHLTVSRTGRLYIVGDDRILVYRINTYSDSTPFSLLHDLPVNSLNPSISPVSGPDGSLYIANGFEISGLNPDLQELWKITLKDKSTSRLTVGPEGKYLYLAAKNEGLVMINVQTGDYTTDTLSNQYSIRNSDKLVLHAPIVIRHPDGTDKIYIAANSVNSGVLDCFDNLNTKPGKYNYKTKMEPLKRCWKLSGLWSQPTPDRLPTRKTPDSKLANENKKIYAVRVDKNKGTLEAIDWLDSITADAGTAFDVGDGSYLLNGGNLVIDSVNNCFVWNGSGDSIGLYIFGTGQPIRFIDIAHTIPQKARLLFGNDGTLYALGVDDRILRTIIPSYTLCADTGAELSSPTHLRITGSVGKMMILKAGGNIVLDTGFSVKKGAEVHCRTGL
jgi:hypothetical protein